MVEVAHPAVAGGQLKLSYKAAADGSYPGFDRFGRVEWQTWTSADGGTVHDRLAYGYDRASNRIWKMDHKANGVGGAYAPRHEAYQYDGLHRLVKAQRGMLKSGQGGLTAPFGGDANADGVADWNNDYLAFQNGVVGLGQGWAYGDFDGNGVIDWDNDFPILQNGILFPPTRNVVATWQWSLDALGNWRGYLYDAGDGATWDLNQTRTHNAVNEIDVDDDHGNNPGNSITASVGDDWIDPKFDAAGNMTSGPKPGAETTRIHMKYDAWNRMAAVFTDNDGATIAHYRYDGLGRRIQKTVEGSPDVTYDYYYNEARQVLEVWKDGDDDHPLEQYVWDGRYVHSPALRWRDGNCDGDYADEGDSVLYYCNDANFNVTALVDAASGAVVERYWYEPYGQVHVCDGDWTPRENNGSAYANEIHFTGHRLDPETGFYYGGARYYHPTLGSWAARDEGAGELCIALYAYVGSSPVRYLDVWGMARVDGNYIVVEKGDTMWGIAKRFTGSGANVDRFDPPESGNYNKLRPGERVAIPGKGSLSTGSAGGQTAATAGSSGDGTGQRLCTWSGWLRFEWAGEIIALGRASLRFDGEDDLGCEYHIKGTSPAVSATGISGGLAAGWVTIDLHWEGVKQVCEWPIKQGDMASGAFIGFSFIMFGPNVVYGQVGRFNGWDIFNTSGLHVYSGGGAVQAEMTNLQRWKGQKTGAGL